MPGSVKHDTLSASLAEERPYLDCMILDSIHCQSCFRMLKMALSVHVECAVLNILKYDYLKTSKVHLFKFNHNHNNII